MIYAVRKPLLWSIVLSASLAGVGLGFAAGRSSSPAITDEDLIPAGVNNCVTAIIGRLDLLHHPEAMADIGEAAIAEIQTLPARCNEPEINDILLADYPALMNELGTSP